jgi:hypothetical protein
MSWWEQDDNASQRSQQLQPPPKGVRLQFPLHLLVLGTDPVVVGGLDDVVVLQTRK